MLLRVVMSDAQFKATMQSLDCSVDLPSPSRQCSIQADLKRDPESTLETFHFPRARFAVQTPQALSLQDDHDPKPCVVYPLGCSVSGSKQLKGTSVSTPAGFCTRPLLRLQILKKVPLALLEGWHESRVPCCLASW